jgi:hypothetical protein
MAAGAGEYRSVRWSVYPRGFGTGPFRWALMLVSTQNNQPIKRVYPPFGANMR